MRQVSSLLYEENITIDCFVVMVNALPHFLSGSDEGKVVAVRPNL